MNGYISYKNSQVFRRRKSSALKILRFSFHKGFTPVAQWIPALPDGKSRQGAEFRNNDGKIFHIYSKKFDTKYYVRWQHE